MKIYFYFSVFDRMFTDLALELSSKYNSLKCCGYAYGRRKFFNKFDYESIIYFSDIQFEVEKLDLSYLNDIESEYNFLISDCIHAERNFNQFSKNEKLCLAQEIIKSNIELLHNFKPDLVILEGIDDFTSLFLYHYCIKQNIPFYYFVYARLGSYLIKSNSLDTGPVDFQKLLIESKKEYESNKLNLEDTKLFIQEYIKNKRQPSYVTDGSMTFKNFGYKDFSVILSVLKMNYVDKKSFGISNPLLLPYQRLKRIKFRNEYYQYFKNKFINISQEGLIYFIYPLHFHPEAATLIQGRYFNDQIRIIEMISKALPSNIILIVKEHKVSIGRRNIKFYKEIDSFHNVYFVSEHSDVYDLISKSLGVITISSSMGLEALMLGRPVMVFGDIFYQFSKNVIQVKEFSLIREYIKSMLLIKFDYEDILIFFHTYRKLLINVSPGFSPENYNKESIVEIAKNI